MGLRISNALVSYVMYIWKMIWPMNLAIHYPFPSAIPAWQVIGASVLLISVTSAVFVASSRHPYLSVGWLWYIGTLLPVSGIMQGGVWPAMADRWAYVPLIGVYIMVSWGAPELVSRWRFKKIALTASVGIVLSILTVTSWIQAGYWMNSITLFEHALKVTDKNDIAHINLGAAFMEAGNLDGAIKHYEEAARINPDANIYNILGKAMAEKGNENEAIRYFSRSIELNPSDARIHSILAMSLLKQGNVREAVEHYRRALELKPGLVDAHNGLGVALARNGDMDGAIHGFQEALRIEPGNISALSNVAMVYGGRGDYDKALDALRKIIQVQPGSPGAYYNIACIYARQGKVDESVKWLKEAVERGFADWVLLKQDKDLENIRGTAYYEDLMRLHGNG
jgi:Flp pilus assembly protein TadD